MIVHFYRLLLFAYPASLRREFGEEMTAAVAETARSRQSLRSQLRLIVDLIVDFCTSLPRAWSGTPPTGPRRRPRRSALMPNLTADLKDAFRLFKRSPAFATGAALTLALGIGASTAIFSLADAAVLHPLPIPDASRVLQTTFSWSYPDFRDVTTEQTTFSSVAAWAYPPFGIEHDGSTLQVIGAGVSGDYFTLAGQRPVIGRLLNSTDDQAGSALAIVMSERLWRREFAASPAVLGSTLMVNRRPATMVGIVPAGFRGLSLQIAPEIFVPLAVLPDVATGFLASPDLLTNRGRVWLNWAGRLTADVTPARAEEQAAQIYRRHRPDAAKNAADRTPWFMSVTDRATGASIRAGASTAADLRHFVGILLGSTAVTLLLACATVANLLLVRAERRRREFSVRSAPGAGRARLARLLLVESAGIGLAGGLAGAGVAAFTLNLLQRFALPGQISIQDLRVTVDARMLFASAGLGLFTALFFGSSPVWQLRRINDAESLRSGYRSSARQPLRALLVSVQVALCVVLMSGGLAFGRAVQYALTLDLGFNTAKTTIVTINPAIARVALPRLEPFQRQTLDVLRQQPKVRAAAWAAIRPMSGAMISPPVIEGYTPAKGEDMSVQTNIVSDGYFETMAIPIQSGRALSVEDTAASARVAVISASMAKKYWPGRDAVGGRLSQENPGAADPKWISVVGVAGDIQRAVGEPAPTLLYLPATQSAGPFAEMDYLIVRTVGDPGDLAADLGATLRGIDPTIPVTKVTTMRSHLGATLMAHELGLTLFLLFAALSVLLTGLGLYAVVAAAVAMRTREIGIRVALGAGAATVIRLVMKQGVVPVAVGLVAGLAVAAGSAKFIASFMFSLPALTPLVVATLIVAVGMLSFLAMLLPARRALAVEPTVALRAD